MLNSNTERQARPNGASKKFVYDPASMLLPHEKYGREQAQLDKLKHLGPKNEAPAPVPILRTETTDTAPAPTTSPNQDSGSQASFAESHPPPYSEVPAQGDPLLHERPGNTQAQAAGSSSGPTERACRFEPEPTGARRGSTVPSAVMTYEEEQELSRLKSLEMEAEADDGTTESPALLSDWEVVETLGESSHRPDICRSRRPGLTP
jgi:hypothetical protein